MLKNFLGILAVAMISTLSWAQNSPNSVNTTPTSSPNSHTQQAPKDAQYLNDAQIAQMFHEINQGAVQAAKMVLDKTSSNQIKTLAQQEVKDHEGLELAGKNMEKRTKLTPAESENSKAFKSDYDNELNKLKTLKKEDFDSTYLARVVMYHQRARDLVDRSLLPNAKDQGWKELLTKEKTVLEEHLQHAITIQKMPHR
jgi:predicted outer membrane protein